MNDCTSANQRVNTYWNSPLCIAEYDQTHAQGIGAELDDQVWKEEFRTYLPPPPAHVLDLGCGTGFASVLLAEMGYAVTGMDQSENMLQQARQKAANRKVNVTWVQGNVMAPQLPPEVLAVFDGSWFKNPECTGNKGTGNKDQPHSDPHARPESEKQQLWAQVYTPEFLAALPLLGDEPQQKLAALMQDAGFTQVTHSRMPHANAMYRQHRGPNWQEDQMYVVRGQAPAG